MKSFKTSKKKIKTSVPRSFDETYTGSEPSFLTEVVSQKQMADAYTYYNYHYDYTDSRKFLIAYMKSKKFDKVIVEKIQNLPDTFHVPTVGWIARILTRGAKINKISQSWFEGKIHSLVDYTPKIADTSQPRKLTIQDRINAQFDEHVSELEERIDQFFVGKTDTFDMKEYLSNNPINGPVAKRIVQHYERLLAEYDLALQKKDDQINQAYSNISRVKLKRMREFLVIMLEPLKTESKKVVVRTTRCPRVKTAAQQVKKLKHMLSFKDLGINSVSPESIIGASQLWVYNVKTRKLGVYHSEGVAGLKVKGSTILAFDQKTSTSKKLRKPDKVLPTVVSGGKVALRTVLDNVKAVASQLTGRINNDTILLRTVK